MTGDPATSGPIAGDDAAGETPGEPPEGEAPAQPLPSGSPGVPNLQSRTPIPESRTPSSWLGPAIVALIAWGTILPWCAPDGPAAPGLTLDEPFNVQQGVKLAERLRSFDLPGYARQTAELPDHPPLGRVWLGLANEVSQVVAGFSGGAVAEVTAARWGSATAFALTILLVGTVTGRWFGQGAGLASSLAVALMPRTYGHAHLAALESCVNLSYAAAVLAAAEGWKERPTFRMALISGVVFGLALLTKIQAIFLPLAVALWILFRFRLRGIVPLAIWGATGLIVFFAGWPWLWSDPVGHISRFLGRAAHRPTVLAWYLGEVYRDRAVPAEYPWLIFLTTVPLGLQLLGLIGTFRGQRASPTNANGSCLVLAAILVPLVAFSVPGVPVYDADRLFSMVYPLWAIFVGLGVRVLLGMTAIREGEAPAEPRAVGDGAETARQEPRPPGGHRGRRLLILVILAIAFASPVIEILRISPCYLSYYNLLVGGLPGAERLGLPTTYWGDSLTNEFLERAAAEVPMGSTVQVCPVMVEGIQLKALEAISPTIRQRKLKLVPWHTDRSPWVLMFARKDYLDPEFRNPSEETVIVEMRREGVLLAALIHLR